MSAEPPKPKSETSASDERVIAEISSLVHSLTGIQLGEKQKSMVSSRVKKRIAVLGLKSEHEYAEFLKAHSESETAQLVSLLTTHHTYFFREFAHFKHLETTALPALIKKKRSLGQNKIAVWSAACSTGQEVYSLAMFVQNYLAKNAPDFTYEILGTDVDPKSLQIAQNGVYRGKELEDVSLDLRGSHWAKGTGEIAGFVKAKASIKSHCRFEPMNLLAASRSATAVKFDIIFCRNVFIYFNSEQIKAITATLLKSLSENGALYLGVSESLSGLGLPCQVIGPSVYSHLTSHALVAPVKGARALPSKPLKTLARKTRILVIDDSVTIQKLLKSILESDPSCEVVGAVSLPSRADEAVRRLKPDVITMDIHMPEMNGVQLLRLLHPKFGIPTVMITSVSREESDIVLEALDAGAVDYIQKPGLNEIGEIAPMIIEKIKIAAAAKSHASANRKPASSSRLLNTGMDLNKIVAIGSSTGGTEALREVFTRLPAEIPAIVVVQHIPAIFSEALARRLNDLCPFEVKEAEDGDELIAGRVLIAPGGRHLKIVKSKNGAYRAVVYDGETVNRHRPSVDVLFDSVAAEVGSRAVGVILTGMGADGAKGLLRMRAAGARTIAQDEATSVVFGMPREAIKLGAAEVIAPLDLISEKMVTALTKQKRTA